MEILTENRDLANHLLLIGNYLKLDREGFRSKAFLDASDRILKEKAAITSGPEARRIPGIGASIAGVIDEFLLNGTSARLEELKTKHGNYEILQMFMKIHGVGPVSALRFYKKGYRTIEELSRDPGLTTAQRVGIEFLTLQKRIPRNEMFEILAKIRNKFLECEADVRFDITGSFRRELEDSGDIDMLVEDMDMETVLSMLEEYIVSTIARGETKFMGLFKHGMNTHRIDIRIIEKKSYPFALLYFTGSQKTNIIMRLQAIKLGFTLNEYGLYDKDDKEIPCTSEADIFTKLNLAYLNPNER